MATPTWLERMRDILERPLGRYSLVGDKPIFEAEQFPWVTELEAEWRTIQKELAMVLLDAGSIPSFQDISASQAALTTDNLWKTYFFYGYGYKAEKNCAACPETTRLLERLPGMKTAFFSILEPHKHIPPHRGPYKGVLRYHLGLIVPEKKELCRIRVDDQIAHWDEGHSLIFDDCFEHEVWNDTDERRVVLFVDFLRPLPKPLDAINRLIIWLVGLTPWIQDGRKKLDDYGPRAPQGDAVGKPG